MRRRTGATLLVAGLIFLAGTVPAGAVAPTTPRGLAEAPPGAELAAAAIGGVTGDVSEGDLRDLVANLSDSKGRPPTTDEITRELLVEAGAGAGGTFMVDLDSLTPTPEQTDIAYQSASSRDGDVVIKVTGTGLDVTKWQTTADHWWWDATVCYPAAYFKANGYIEDVHFFTGCFAPPDRNPLMLRIFWHNTATVPATYVNGTQLSDAWDPSSTFAGTPSITVHS